VRSYFELKKADLRRQFQLFDTDCSGDLSLEVLTFLALLVQKYKY